MPLGFPPGNISHAIWLYHRFILRRVVAATEISKTCSLSVESLTAGSIDDDGSDPYYGFGMGVSIDDRLQIYGEWVRFDIRNSIDTLGMGLRYTN